MQNEEKPSTYMPTPTYPCSTCRLRAHYDRDPKSVLGRLWRWHINFCPGFRAYFTHQDDAAKALIREKYDFKKYL
jgi:hypothetical protein